MRFLYVDDQDARWLFWSNDISIFRLEWLKFNIKHKVIFKTLKLFVLINGIVIDGFISGIKDGNNFERIWWSLVMAQ